MYGAIFGDIIGSRFEFDRGGKTKKFKLFTEDDSFTDDTVMTIAVGEGLINAGPDASTEDIEREVIISMKKWGEKYPNAGYGCNFWNWLFVLQNPRPYGSYGNGSAMRVSAAGWLYDSLEKTREVARATAEVTHNHPEGIKGADCTATVIYMARTGKSKEEILEYVTKEFGYDISETLDQMRKRHKHVESCQDSLPKALRSFFDGDSYEEVVRNAVSLGGDTDTLAAIAGSMAEAFYGMPLVIYAEGKTYLPEDMLEVLDKFDGILGRGFGENSEKPNYEGNKLIKQAIIEAYRYDDVEHCERLIEAIMGRVFEEGQVPTPMVDKNNVLETIDPEKLMLDDPVIHLEKDMRLSIDTMQDKEGKLWIPLFTDEEEINRQPTANIHMNINILNIIKDAYNREGCEGLVINPFGVPFMLQKDILAVMLEGYDKVMQSEE